MHNNYHFFRKLTPILGNTLKDAVISECFSQEKDELIVRFESGSVSHYIRADLSPAFPCLCFPEEHHRARKNSVDLFPALVGERVQAIHQTPFDRSFTIRLSNETGLTFKMHGNRSNVLVSTANNVTDIFRNSLKADRSLNIASLSREVDWGYDNFLRHTDNLASLYFTFGKVIWRLLKMEGFDSLTQQDQWNRIQELLKSLQLSNYYHCVLDGELTFSMLPIGTVLRTYHDPVVAINTFYHEFVKQDSFTREKSLLETQLRKKIMASENFLLKGQHKLRELETDGSYKVWADLLMANLHVLMPGQESVSLPDFYHEGRTVEIRLKKDLSPQKNAAVFYTKSKKQQTELARLQETLDQKRREIEHDQQLSATLASINELKSLKAFKAAHHVKIEKEGDQESMPFHETEFGGYRILVGKSATGNDEMLQRYSYKDDLWLHAKDVTGSHVLVKHKSGSNIPAPVVERAAELAAFYSKRKTDTLCPVSVTPRKFVRKRKGDPAGAVVVERERVILVTPRP